MHATKNKTVKTQEEPPNHKTIEPTRAKLPNHQTIKSHGNHFDVLQKILNPKTLKPQIPTTQPPKQQTPKPPNH